jgi:hypothetical protein
MDSKRDHQFKTLLQSWQPKADLPPRFESEVWRRIALSQEKPASWLNFDWLFRITNQPRLAFAIVMTAMVIGSGSAMWQAQRNYNHQMAGSESRYIHSVDPFSNVSLASNP